MKLRILLSLLMVFAWSGSASAYFDPGTGSAVLQLLLAGIGGALVVGRMYWAKIKSVFGADPSEKSSMLADDAD